MGKNKLKKFSGINFFPNVLQPDYKSDIDFKYKGKWSKCFFNNNNPIVLEIGCGKGEYTAGLAKNFPGKNFIGIDIKGDRIWHGAKAAIIFNIKNAAFLRIIAEKIDQYFDKNEVSEIWLTFPDPQPRKSKEKKRLTSPRFIGLYKKILTSNNLVHLKTDNEVFFQYTHRIIKEYNHDLHFTTNDLYNCNKSFEPAAKNIQTYYEELFLENGSNIYYMNFSVNCC